jgi:hypothetical protein
VSENVEENIFGITTKERKINFEMEIGKSKFICRFVKKGIEKLECLEFKK